MPLYEYQCDACGLRFERIQKFSDAPVSECPTCGAAVRRLISSPAIQFKGSGFYITDYAKSSNSGNTEKATKDEGAKTDTGGKQPDAAKSDSSAKDTSAPPAKPAPADSKS
jgi:putative FmdB family regulatory protein